MFSFILTLITVYQFCDAYYKEQNKQNMVDQTSHRPVIWGGDADMEDN